MSSRCLWIPVLCLAAAVLKAADRPQFGEAWSRNMTSPEVDLPATFDPATGRHLRWSVPLAGPGTESHATPVIARGRVFVGTNNELPRDPRRKGDRGILLCLSEATGALEWQLAVPKREEDIYHDWPKTGMASPVTVEGDRVYLVDNRGVVQCLDLRGQADGNQGPFRDEATYLNPRGTNAPPVPVPAARPDADILWSFDLTRQAGIWSHDGAHSSILIHGDYLYINSGTGVDNTHRVIRTPEAPSLVVLDKRTGRWVAHDGLGIAPRIFHCTWSSPALTFSGGGPRILFAGGDGVVYGFDPYRPAGRATGPVVLANPWRFDFDPSGPKTNVGSFLNNRREGPSNIYGMPVAVGDRMYVAGGGDWFWGKNEAWVRCVRLDGRGDVSASNTVWSYPLGRHTMGTPAVANGMVFCADSTRTLHCIDAETGRGLWTHELDGEAWASALVADGKVYLGTRRGGFWTFALSREKLLLGHVPLGSPISATAVAANGNLYVATGTRLYAAALKAGPGTGTRPGVR
jgi:outer membrane protein assembly factor BamB